MQNLSQISQNFFHNVQSFNNPGDLVSAHNKKNPYLGDYLCIRCKDSWIGVNKFRCKTNKFSPCTPYFLKKILLLNIPFLRKYKTKLFCSQDLLHLLSARTKDNLFS